MKVNHEQTKNIILSIVEMLKTQAQVAKKYKADLDTVTADEMISQKLKNDRIAELRNNYIAKHSELKDKVEEKLNAIISIELENEKILELDVPEFSNTLAAINAAKGHLPSEVIDSIKLNFAGQYQALLAIAAAFKNYGVELSKYGYSEYTASVKAAINPLIIQAQNIEQSETSTFISLRKLFKDVIRFGEVRGIKFSDSDKTFPFDDEIRTLISKQAMGLI